MNKIRIIFLSALLLATASLSQAQTDTLRLDFKSAEKLFLSNNLNLLAARYHVNASAELVKQAALWDNPTLNTDQNIYDNSHKYFNHSDNNGQIYVQLTQLFKTAGKRGKQIQLAKDDALIQEAEFNDLLRNLRYNLLLDFSQLSGLIEQNKVYSSEIVSATNLVSAIDQSYSAGNSSLKDAVRLKALLFGLQSDLIENNKQIVSLQAELRTLLAVKEAVFIAPKMADVSLRDLPSADTLIARAKINRGDYLSSRYQALQAVHNVAYQKALSSPDITAGIEYDKSSSYLPNVWGLTISLPLPFFDRNQGNIKSAKLAAQSEDYTAANTEFQLKNDVTAAMQQYQLSRQMLSQNQTNFYDTYDQVFNNMMKSYKDRQIGLVELIDFFDSYKDTRLKILQQQSNMQKAVADLEYSTGSAITNP